MILYIINIYIYIYISLTEDPVVRCYSHGQSNPTYFIRYGGKNMVLRKKPVSFSRDVNEG